MKCGWPSTPNPVGPEAYNRQAQAYLRYDALDRLAEVKSPTLVIVGEQDLLTPPWICREVADRIPGSQFEIIKGQRARARWCERDVRNAAVQETPYTAQGVRRFMFMQVAIRRLRRSAAGRRIGSSPGLQRSARDVRFAESYSKRVPVAVEQPVLYTSPFRR
jgi:hypothetical protein